MLQIIKRRKLTCAIHFYLVLALVWIINNKINKMMEKFKIRDTYKHISEIYEVEAETKEKALDRYVNELAGMLERIDFSYEPEAEDGIEVID